MAGKSLPEERQRLSEQVLRNLIDETLQIQAAKSEKIEVKQSDIDKTVQRVAENVKKTPAQLADFLDPMARTSGRCGARSRARSPGSGCSAAKIESGVSVGDDEVKAVLDKMNASKGTEEYQVGEIYLSATPATRRRSSTTPTRSLPSSATAPRSPVMRANIRNLRRLRSAAISAGCARNSCPRRSPTRMRQMDAGAISDPIPVGGRLFDHRRPGHAQNPDGRSARRRSQPQTGVDRFPEGHARAAGRSDRRPLCRSREEHRRLRRRGEDR